MRKTNRALLIQAVGYLILFSVFFNLMFAPWAWDNIKLLMWPYLGFTRLAYLTFEKHLNDLYRWAIGILLFATGFAALSFTLRPPVNQAALLFTVAELGETKAALENVKFDAVFASAAAPVHTLQYFGRIRALGYDGHLWSHGIDAKAVFDKHERLMKGDADWITLIQELKVTHIFGDH